MLSICIITPPPLFQPIRRLAGAQPKCHAVSDLVAWYDYDGVNPSEDQLAEMVRIMGDKPVLAMRHHGMLAIGRTVAEAFHRAYYFNKACQGDRSRYSVNDRQAGSTKKARLLRAKAFFQS